MKTKLLNLFCSGFYSGLSPLAPGTAGSLLYLVLWYFIFSQNIYLEIIILILLSLAGYLAVSSFLPLINTNTYKKSHDPSFIVIDEWAGLSVALLPATSESYLEFLVAFLLFRVFDIAKPGIIKKMEKLPGAGGIMGDDLVAGIFAAIILTSVKLAYGF